MVVAISFRLFSSVPFTGGNFLAARVLNSTCLCLKSVLRLSGVGG
jgi:hypothetical protein